MNLSINIELNVKEINIEISKNILKMLYRRKLLNDHNNTFEKIKNQINNESIIKFKLNDDTECNINILNIKMTTISEDTPVDQFLSSNLDIHKILVFKDLTKKVAKQIHEDYKNAEFFFEHELLEDIPSKIFIPEHQLLIKEEKNELYNKFNENELSIIYTTDMMSRYYNAKSGDVFRIIRPSITSGKSIFYRKVVHGSLDLIFG